MALKGFEEITDDLSDYERYTLVDVFVRGFQKKIGKERAVTNRQIVKSLKGKYKISDTRVRKIVNYIRTHNLLPGLIATSKGYYISQDITELKDYIQSLMGRENEIRRVRKSMVDYLKQIHPQIQGYLSFTEADR